MNQTFFIKEAQNLKLIPPNSAGGFLGLFNTTTSYSPQNQIVLVEFDSFYNSDWDPPGEHVGINNNSISSAVSTPWNASFHSRDTANVRITYNATSQNLSVSWSYQNTSNAKERTSISYKINLMKVLPEWVTVGFSAATSHYVERHVLQSWEFSSRKTAETVNLTSINYDLERGAGPRRFSYTDLASATNNFSNDRKLGEGGFGTVYKGYLKDLDALVAVKKISRGSKQGRKEYITEVKVISSLRHRNLVQLIGWCHDRGEFLLVYEFMPNGSLDCHLFGKKSPLTWAVRDIKSSNVMLDSSFNVKLGDFGLARLMDHELGPQTTGLAGTLGYLAPEYVTTGRASKESDVYSFGVVALEIATGRKSVDRVEEDNEFGLVEWVWDLYGKGNLVLGVDERLQMEVDQRQVECLMIVGLWCAHPDQSLRPSIRQAIHVLNFEAALPDLPPKMPVPFYHAPPMSVSSGEPLITTSLEAGR
ncbi:hypothetical protein FNV43_RR17440 [Rhamnella rubrinervis]|uniref:Protein kinase domain-containing protein n=1 Tax=Rhamnella rubrinervis TaxID=2594499 RepID=A0A8K0GXV8_9ROSA|nr:hypothetical protein FNV43_RR17440 [Rhamnella rubrinervis]